MSQRPNGASQYPPAAYAQAVPADLTAAPPASLIKWFSLTAVAGVVVGGLWWMLAPSGAFYGSGEDVSTWLPRDLVLAGLGLVAGIVTAFLLLPQRRRTGAAFKVLVTVIGCAVGSIIAWQLGTLAGALWGHTPAHPASDSIAFSLRTYSVLAIWPGSCALILFIGTLGSLLRSSPEDERNAAAHS